MKILILLTYYERPELVKNFLRSLLKVNANYQDWHLAFIDDGSIRKGRPIVERILGNLAEKVTFYDSEMSPDMKKICGGSYIGLYMNQAIRNSDAELVIMAGDDDEMCPDYLNNLEKFFACRPDCMSCYSNVYVYNPLIERATDTYRLYSDDPSWKGHQWFGKPINPSMKVDGIQCCWRRKCCTTYGAYFPYPIISNHDAMFFQELYERCGSSFYSGFVGMWKGRHDGQLIKRIQQNTTFNNTVDKKRPPMFL